MFFRKKKNLKQIVEKCEDKIKVEEIVLTKKNETYKKYEAEKIVFPIYERIPETYSSKYYYDADNNIYRMKKGTNPNKAVIMCAGDLMCEPAMGKAMMFNQSYFFEHGFEKVRNIFIKSDFAIANLETTVTKMVPYAHEVHRIEGRYHCNAPIEYLDALRFAGFDAFAQANNHNADAGADGLIDTVRNVHEKDFMHTGLFASEEDSRYLLVDINNIKVAFLSYTEHINRDLDKRILNELGQNVLVNRYSEEKLKKDVQVAKAAGAEFVICYIHFWCKEYSHEVTTHQETVAKEMANAGVDCILGSHSHSLQRYDEIISDEGKRIPVIYSLGNFMTSDSTSMITRKSIIYKLTLIKRDGQVSIEKEECIPCRVIEGIGRSSYDIWPTSPEWTDNVKRNILLEAEKEILEVIGSKLPKCEG